jgi:integrase
LLTLSLRQSYRVSRFLTLLADTMPTHLEKTCDPLVSVRITKGHVDRITPPTQGQVFLRDIELKGFQLRVTSGGAKTFCLEKRIKGRSVRRKIGAYPDISVERARQLAHVWLGQIAEGKNPFEEEDAQAREKLTLNFVLEEYLCARKNLRERTSRDYRQLSAKAFKDWLQKPLKDITKVMVQQRHMRLGSSSGPHYANSAMQLLRALFNFAAAAYDDSEGQPLLTVNPVIVLTNTRAWFPKKRRRGVLTRSQLPDWFRAVEGLRATLKDPKQPEKGLDSEAALVSDYLLLLLFTGLRRREAARLRFEHIDLVDQTLHVNDTKNGEPLILPMSDAVQAIVERRLRETKGGFVFPGGGKHGHLIEPKRHVRRVIAASGVPFMLHDLRRTFITVAESLDLSHYAIKRLVNHKLSSDVTAGYVVANIERLRERMQRIADRIRTIIEAAPRVDATPATARAG